MGQLGQRKKEEKMISEGFRQGLHCIQGILSCFLGAHFRYLSQ